MTAKKQAAKLPAKTHVIYDGPTAAMETLDDDGRLVSISRGCGAFVSPATAKRLACDPTVQVTISNATGGNQ